MRRLLAGLTLALTLLLGATPASAQIALQTSGSDNSTAFGITVDVPLTISSGSNLYLGCFVAWQQDSTEPDAPAPVWSVGSQTLTKVSPATSPNNGGKRIAYYERINPATGTGTVVFTSGQEEWNGGAICAVFTGVHQTTPSADYTTTAATGTSTTAAVNVSNVVTGNWTLQAAIGISDGDATWVPDGTGETEIAESRLGTGGGDMVMQYDSSTTGTVNMASDFGLDDWMSVGVRLIQAAGGGTPAPSRLLLLGCCDQ